MVTVFVPVTGANHVSVGYQDTVGTSANEDPENPSVGDDSYQVGIESDCYEAQAEPDPGEVTEAATSDGFCGKLLYNEGVPQYEEPSPPDQDLRDDIGTFDVVRTWYVGSVFGVGCTPICDSPGQNQTWTAIHEAGAALGLTDDAETAHQAEDERAQAFGFRVDHAHPNGVVQNTANVWEMNGWTVPAPVSGTFVGFLTDADETPIDDEQLQQMVDRRVDITKTLSEETVAGICGYTPDRTFQSTGEQSFCDGTMLWVDGDDENDGGDPTRFDSYDEECQSPAYVCGGTTGGYWQAEAIGLAGAYAGRYQGEFMRWHWVVAPNQPECGNTQPGFDFDGDGRDNPYMAHDLDVYTPPQQVSGAPEVSTENPMSYAQQFADDPAVPDLPGPVEDAVGEAEAVVDPYTREDRTEPNNGDEIDGLAETSQAIEVDRQITSCEEIVSDEERVDPWVNIADATVASNREVSYRDPVVEERTPFEVGTDSPRVGLYGNDDQAQDASNDPTPDRYATEGKVGMFADKDDDGSYEQVTGPEDSASTFGAGVYLESNIQQTGAYPMLWDMHATVEDGEAQVASEEGCTFTGDQAFAGVMEEAGYGPNTGLVQAIYLKEPTEFSDVNTNDPQTAPYPAGNNIYLLMNQAARELWDGDASSSNGFALDSGIDNLVTSLENHVTANYGADEDSLEVHQPGTVFELDSDFDSQCGDSTGGFDSTLSFTHNCELDCSGDTIATMYTFELNGTGEIGGGDIPFLVADGASDPHDFSSEVRTWIDVDPFDGDPDRNDDGTPAP
jgi:hypothetical protein